MQDWLMRAIPLQTDRASRSRLMRSRHLIVDIAQEKASDRHITFRDIQNKIIDYGCIGHDVMSTRDH